MHRLARSPLLQLTLVVLVAAAVYLPFLGVRPLDSSEGHRAVPGWTMLESRDFWHQKMFGLTYIRKPPGMAWAIAASSAWLGETPFAARLPSALAAILMSGVAWWYGRRWFGVARADVARAYRPVGLVHESHEEYGPVGPRRALAGVSAGLAQALMPLMWSPGRTGEIEMLNNFGTQLFALGLLDLLVRGNGSPGNPPPDGDTEERPLVFLCELVGSMARVLLPAAGLFIAALAKGPASAPVLGGVLIGACVAKRSARVLRNGSAGVALVFGLGAIALVGLKFWIANDTPDAVREDVGQFLWSGKRVLGMVTLAPLAFVSAMPMALAMLAPPGTSTARDDGPGAMARALRWAWSASLAILVLCGMANPRYAMPAAVLLAPLVPFALNMLRPRLEKFREEGTKLPRRPRHWLGSTAAWAGLLGMAAWWFIALTSISPTEDQNAGKKAASLMSSEASRGVLWANDVIESRPDVLWLLHTSSPGLIILWNKRGLLAGELPGKGGYVLLRSDDASEESARFQPRIASGRLHAVCTGRVRRQQFSLYEDLGEPASP